MQTAHTQWSHHEPQKICSRRVTWSRYHALLSIGMSDGVTINRIAGLVGEALIMTGVGLAVAIPAVLAYKGSSQKMENKAR
mgnify:CR=1 FL=1